MSPIIERITTDPEWMLAQLEREFRADRVRMDRKCPRHNLTRRCRYCLGHWVAFAGNDYAEGHVTCFVSHEFQQQATELLDSSPHMTFQRVANRLGVGVGAVRAWWNQIKGNPRP